MPILANLGADTGFINLRAPEKLDVSGLEKYYESLLKAQAYVQKRAQDGKPDLKEEDFKDLKARGNDTHTVMSQISNVKAELNAGVQKYALGDWTRFSTMPEFKSLVQKVSNWTTNRNIAEGNLKRAQASEEMAKDPKNGTFAFTSDGKPYTWDGTHIRTDGEGVPLPKAQFNKLKEILPNQDENGNVKVDDYDQAHGTMDDFTDYFNKVTTNLGGITADSLPQAMELDKPMGGYISALVSKKIKSNADNLDAARQYFKETLQGSGRPYIGLLDEYQHMKRNGSKEDFNTYLDKTLIHFAKVKLNLGEDITASHIPDAKGSGDDEPKKTGYWYELARLNPNLVNTDTPVNMRLMEPKLNADGSTGRFEKRDITVYEANVPPLKEQAEVFRPGVTVSSLAPMMSFAGFLGPRFDPKDAPVFLLGDGVKGAKAVIMTKEKNSTTWRIPTQQDTKDYNENKNTNLEQKPFVAFDVNVITTPEFASKQKLPAPYDTKDEFATTEDMYPNGIFTPNINEKFKPWVKEIDPADNSILEIAKKNPEFAQAFPNGWNKNSDAVIIRSTIYADPEARLYDDQYTFTGSYGNQTMDNLEVRKQAAHKALVSEQVLKMTQINSKNKK